MSRATDLLKNTGILMIAKISTQVISFLLLPLYTALLTTEDYGRVDIYTSLAMIVIPFLTLQVEMALFRFFITNKDQASQKEIVSTSYAIIAGMTATISIIYLIVSDVLKLPHRWLLFGYYISQALAAVLLQTCRAKGDNIGYGMASFVSSAMAVVLNVLFVAGLGWHVEGILMASILAQLVSCIYMLRRTRIYSYLSFEIVSLGRCRQLLNYSIPLVFNQIASWGINYSNRLIIVVNWGEGINGIFSVASKFSNIVGTFFNVYNVAWTENVVRSMEDEDGTAYISRIFEFTFSIYLILITGIINLLPLVFNVMVNKAFNDAYMHVPILLVGMLFSGMAATLGSIYIAYSKTREVSITTMLAGMCNIVVHLLLLKKYGLYAASISTLLSFVALFIYRYISIRKFFLLNFKLRRIVPQIIVLIFSWSAYNIGNSALILTGFVLNMGYIVYVFFKNRNIIMQMIKKKQF